MSLSFIFMVVSASSLPLLAFLALLLRRNFFKGPTKFVLLAVGVALLLFTLVDTFKEHHGLFSIYDGLTSIITAILTLIILSRFSHGHHHALEIEGAKGVVISEAFHSLLDGAVIGATYLVNPVLGYAATIGIVLHEFPKIIGTLTLFRSVGLSIKKTILYGITAQIGSPVAAILIYVLGKQFDDKQFYTLELASVSSLLAIVFWIIYLEIRFHKKHGQSHSG